MNRERLLPVVLALVCVVALSLVAASVVDPADGGGGSTVSDPTGGDDRDSGENGSSGREPLTDPGQFSFSFGICLPFLLTGEFLAIVIGVALLLWSGLAYRDDGFAASAALVVVGFPAFFLWMLLTNCAEQPAPTSADILPSEPAPPSTGGNASVGIANDSGLVITQPSVFVVLVAATLVVGLLGYALLSSTDDEESEAEPPEQGSAEEGDPRRVTEIGNVAGQIADRLERTTGTENEVFRAWVEMTRHLPVEHPRSSTPSEFADAAVGAGVSREDVAELTELFEEVRYGGEPVTADRERRAVDALRHIEDKYGDEP
ncbi:DUF4129 domain-containing protein [Haloarchaeobius iranensis]|uniref:Protein-glutamine gamma-glutamyltransferase-like C-terminal domain-containing protein n=1 Tax=Haloarchaeobius iranensis TaxID=996166 RepID=A0A1G9W2D4_9EURY|nr:DUF4129 domain-containing protein [Haloarchaeobius iranensis]SDM78225.1 protein of unknown function [Haloarchaeobius iranensis]